MRESIGFLKISQFLRYLRLWPLNSVVERNFRFEIKAILSASWIEWTEERTSWRRKEIKEESEEWKGMEVLKFIGIFRVYPLGIAFKDFNLLVSNYFYEENLNFLCFLRIF